MSPLLLLIYVAFTATAGATMPVTAEAKLSGSRHSGFTHSRGVALVIGNTHYITQPLRTPVNDSRAVSRLLRTMGFDVIALENATRREMVAGLGELEQRLETKEVALVFFAGHTLQVEGSATLLPTDARTGSVAALRDSGVDVDDIAAALSSRRPDQPHLIIVDGCLNGTSHESPGATPGRITRANLPKETLIAFAASPGGVALDGTGRHGLFTDELLRVLPKPGLSVDQALSRVQVAVGQRSGWLQVPFISSSLSRPLHLPAAAVNVASEPAAQTPPYGKIAMASMLTRGILPQSGEARIELEFWKSVENSTDAADYEAYLKKYPNGRFAPLAKARAARYKEAAPREAEQPPKAEPSAPAVEDMDVDYVTTVDSNIREEPSLSGRRLGRLKAGETVHVTGRVADGKWYRIKAPSGETAYMWADLLTKPAAPVTPPAEAPEAKAPPPAVATPAPEPPPPRGVVQKAEAGQDCPVCPAMVTLPAGTFIMGDNHGYRTEKPAHKVSISHPFAIGKYEVTTGQWRACVKDGGCTFDARTSGPSPDAPVRDISWNDAQQYVRWLSKLTGQHYRLPTEAEWEYAARAGTTTRYWWGEHIGSGNADCEGCGGPWNHEVPADVGAFPANPFGIYGMNGGVWEWVSDCWYKSYDGAPSDGSSRDEPNCLQHVIRGGAWRNDSTYVHSASRFKYDTNVRYIENGFRVAKTLQ